MPKTTTKYLQISVGKRRKEMVECLGKLEVTFSSYWAVKKSDSEVLTGRGTQYSTPGLLGDSD